MVQKYRVYFAIDRGGSELNKNGSIQELVKGSSHGQYKLQGGDLNGATEFRLWTSNEVLQTRDCRGILDNESKWERVGREKCVWDGSKYGCTNPFLCMNRAGKNAFFKCTDIQSQANMYQPKQYRIEWKV